MEDDKSAGAQHDAASNTAAAAQWPEGTLLLPPLQPSLAGTANWQLWEAS